MQGIILWKEQVEIYLETLNILFIHQGLVNSLFTLQEKGTKISVLFIDFSFRDGRAVREEKLIMSKDINASSDNEWWKKYYRDLVLQITFGVDARYTFPEEPGKEFFQYDIRTLHSEEIKKWIKPQS